MTSNPATCENTQIDKKPRNCYSIPNVGQRVASENPVALKPVSSDDFPELQKSESKAMQSDSGKLSAAQLHVLWRETDRVVEGLAKAVMECKRVDEASNFGRWIRFSGVLEILEAHPAPFPLTVDAKGLKKKVSDMLFECGELYRGGKHDPRYAASDIAEINRKLDIIAAHISQPSPPLMATTADVGDSAEPVLQVLQGGVS